MTAGETTAAGRTLLVLDLDETLIRAGGAEVVAADFTAAAYRVMKRPFVSGREARVARQVSNAENLGTVIGYTGGDDQPFPRNGPVPRAELAGRP